MLNRNGAKVLFLIKFCRTMMKVANEKIRQRLTVEGIVYIFVEL
jgi:hypothetical protein